jgi:hypothetical protein
LTNCGLEPHSDVVRRAECGRIAHLTEFRITRAAWEARGCADSFTYVGDVAYEIAINLSGDHLSTGPSRVAAIPGVTPELEEVRLRA